MEGCSEFYQLAIIGAVHRNAGELVRGGGVAVVHCFETESLQEFDDGRVFFFDGFFGGVGATGQFQGYARVKYFDYISDLSGLN